MDGGGGGGGALDEDLGGDFFAELGDVADDADAAAVLAVKVLEGVDGFVEGTAAERAEAFVDKQGVAAAELADVAEGQRQGEGYQEGFATRDGVGCALAVALIAVADHDAECAGDDVEGVSVVELRHVGVGVVDEVAEQMAQRDVAETFALGVAEQRVQVVPAAVILSSGIEFAANNASSG